MPLDQAAGLRRRRAGDAPRCLHVFFDAIDSTHRLLRALQQRGLRVLLVDSHGRLLGNAPARSLFDWRQQLLRGQLQTLPLPAGDGWHAPGVRADAPGLATLSRGYDLLVFDEGQGVRMPDGARTMIVEVTQSGGALQRAYALLKTVFHSGDRPELLLLGERVACDHLRAACAHFLDRDFADALCGVCHEDDAFAALAVRMSDEETGLAPGIKTGKP